MSLPIDAPAPDFSAPDLDGTGWRLSALRGQVVVLYFWSPACGWCERWSAQLRELQARWGEQVLLLAAAPEPGEDPAELRRAAREHRLETVLPDGEQSLCRLFEATHTPQFFVIDAQGMLRYQGAFNDVTFRQREVTRDYLREAVEAVLAGRRPEPAETHPYGCVISPHLPPEDLPG